MPERVGRPSELDDDLKAKIRTLIFQGRKYKEIHTALDINENTWDTWVYTNYQGFREDLRSWENEILIRIAKANLSQLLQGDDDRIRADLTKFTLETLSKIDFSKKTETDITSGGEQLGVVILPQRNAQAHEADSINEK